MTYRLLCRDNEDWQFHLGAIVADERTAIAACIEKHQTHPEQGFGYMEVE